MTHKRRGTAGIEFIVWMLFGGLAGLLVGLLVSGIHEIVARWVP